MAIQFDPREKKESNEKNSVINRAEILKVRKEIEELEDQKDAEIDRILDGAEKEYIDTLRKKISGAFD